ncbi:MAG: S41 family peptidase [Planctomycetota bacterium]
MSGYAHGVHRSTASLLCYGCLVAVAPTQSAQYLDDFEFVAATAQRTFPAFEKKSVDWPSVCRRLRPRFAAARHDAEHVLNLHRLLAELRDTHSSVRETNIDVRSPLFDGQASGGLWVVPGDEGALLVRALAPGHPLAAAIAPGDEVIEIDGQSAASYLDNLRARAKTWRGFSSQHFLDGLLGTQFFAFGAADSVRVVVRSADGGTAEREVHHGIELDARACDSPPGFQPEGRARALRLDGGIAYLRILGKMDDATAAEASAQIDDCADATGFILDCRGMGGGGDRPALEIAGRFFREVRDNGTFLPIKPTGAWQFAGPLVLLQDASLASSAETFTWSLTETGRAVSVGRPTAGATIIPKLYELPSGLAVIRIGAKDRPTPVRGVRPEGIGSAPDVFVKFDRAAFEGGRDPILETGRAVLQALLRGDSAEAVIAAHRGSD